MVGAGSLYWIPWIYSVRFTLDPLNTSLIFPPPANAITLYYHPGGNKYIIKVNQTLGTIEEKIKEPAVSVSNMGQWDNC